MKKPVQILLVEDNEGDAYLTKEAFEDGNILFEMSWVTDGFAALNFLNKVAPFETAPSPDLILLDINLPKMDGIELLEILKSDTVFRRIPVIMLTTSSSEEDILASYDKHANCYVTKPINMAEFISVVNSIEEFWLKVATLTNRLKDVWR